MDFLLFVPVLLLSIVFHELAHAWQAKREGDDTAEREGRITLNPVSHIDPMGSVLVPMLLWFSSNGTMIFGWAKPVPVNPANYRDPKWGDIRVSLAGIVVNLALAVAFTLAMAGVVAAGSPQTSAVWSKVYDILQWGLFLNLLLAFFNLLPIPPLDGSHVLVHFLPRGVARVYRRVGQVGMLLILALFFIPGAFDVLLWPIDVCMGLADRFVRLWV